ncbi:hypothetical protein TRIUR3_32704 [Triticum urartu]|uniref:Uncharacterized protein n=1 Tax=Triticum urartu TaxID=4572 RepID=M7ZWW5_TRIUA|nr:hypothetical protein TRIUR3_32704 [Triticum urartu]
MKEDARILHKEQVELALLTHEGRSYNALFKHRVNYTKFCDGALNDLSSNDFDHVQCCVYSRDIELTYDQTRFFLQHLIRDIFICCRLFVHVLTPTNTKDCIMKISRSVVSTLKRWVDVPTNARVTLETPDEPTHVITPSSYYTPSSYHICKKDGWMVIEKSSFRYFISAASFVEENVVLVTFKEHNDHFVSIIIQLIP